MLMMYELFIKPTFFVHLAEPPRIITNPINVTAVQGENAMFTTHAIGSEPLNYKWEWMPAVNENGTKIWKSCDDKWSNNATLTVPKVDNCNEGSYRCIVSNFVGNHTSKPAKLEVRSCDETSPFEFTLLMIDHQKC